MPIRSGKSSASSTPAKSGSVKKRKVQTRSEANGTSASNGKSSDGDLPSVIPLAPPPSADKSHDAHTQEDVPDEQLLLDPRVIGHVCEFLTPRDLGRFLQVAKTEVPLAGFGVDWSEDDFTAHDPDRAVSLAFQSGALLKGLYLDNELDFLSKPKDCDLTRLSTLVFVGDRGVGNLDLSPLVAVPNLETLELSNVDGFMNAPALAELKNLKHLKIFLVDQLRDLAMLRYTLAIETLELEGLSSIPDLIPVGALQHLKTLSLERMTGIKDLWPLARCNDLESLCITQCEKLAPDAIAALVNCTNFQKLDIQSVRRLKGLTELQKLSKFKYLRCTDLQIADDLQAVGDLRNLTELYLTDCGRPLPPLPLMGLDRPEVSSRLEVIDLSGNRVVSLAPLASAESLKEVWVQHCSGLKSFNGLENLEDLVEIHAKGARQLQNCQALRNHKSLTVIDLSECPRLSNIQGLGSCEFLEDIDISDTNVKDLKPLANCTSLRKLIANNCEMITSCAALTPKKNPNLVHIEIACPNLEDIGTLARPSLRVVDFTHAADLKSIDGLEGATELRTLNLRDCASVKSLKVLYDLPYFRTLNITGCTRIRRVPPELLEKEKLTIIGDPSKDETEEVAYRQLQKALPSSAPHLLHLCDVSEM
eukprot:gene338-715_t